MHYPPLLPKVLSHRNSIKGTLCTRWNHLLATSRLSYTSEAAQETEAMETHAATLEDLSWMRPCPEPTMPPGLNREQAWAWAMDNFPALSRPSCETGHFSQERSYGACGLLRHACTWHGDVPRAERGQKRRRDPYVQDPMAETEMERQSPQEEADMTDGPDQWRMHQPGDASRGGQTLGRVAARSPDHPKKLLKTET